MALRALLRDLNQLTPGSAVTLRGDPAHHLARVLRARKNDQVILFDGAGIEARAVIEEIATRPRVEIALMLEEQPHAGVTFDRSAVLWLQGYAKGDKMERVVRQATELGVREIWPVYTERSIPRAKDDGRSRGDRLRAIAESAAVQCGRADIPTVRDPMDLETALREIPQEIKLRLIPWEQGGEPIGHRLAHAPNDLGCAVLVGPEGGLDEDEVTRAKSHGFVPVALGPRILRTETVAPALLAVLSHARGDLRV